MVTGAQVERVVRRFDRRLLQLEAEAIGALRTALHQSAAALEEELRRLYRRALEGTSSAGAHIREAHVRQLLAEVRGAQTALALGRDIPVESILTNLQRHATITGAEQALALLTLSEQAIVGLAGGLNVDAILAATRVSSRLTEIGAARVANGTARLLQHTDTAARAIEQHVIDGVTRGQGWSVTARNIRKEVALLDYEAERIVRYESVLASDTARNERYEEAGVQHVRVLATQDLRVCGWCAVSAGRIYKMGELILPRHPNCRCASVPVRPEWVAAGIDDNDWYVQHHRDTLKKAREAGHKIPRGPAPSDRWNGLTSPPKPVPYAEFRRMAA